MAWGESESWLKGGANGYAYLPDARPARGSGKKLSHKILIDTRLADGSRSQLETVIHEFLHASLPQASECHVTEAGRDQSIRPSSRFSFGA